MTKADRKAAIAAYKEVKAVAGIYRATCEADGLVWVGESRNLAAQPNSFWFTLRLGSHRNKALQAAFNRHGEAGIAYAEVERLPEEAIIPVQRTMLKEAAANWAAKLGATRI
jgi:hypothetical protein